MSVNVNELKLVEAVQKTADSQALEVLLQKYQPMILATAKQYYLRLYDYDDWQQEARIVCYQTCLLYQASLNCQFGAFFKLRFHNHIRSLLRRELAVKRRADTQSVAFETCVVEEQLSSFGTINDQVQLSQFDFSGYLELLSYFELQAFRVAVNQICLQTACSELNCTKQQLQRGMDRCRVKLHNYLL